MVTYVKVFIVCRCGKLLGTRNVPSNGARSSGMIRCSGCKKNVQWTIEKGRCFTNYKL